MASASGFRALGLGRENQTSLAGRLSSAPWQILLAQRVQPLQGSSAFLGLSVPICTHIPDPVAARIPAYLLRAQGRAFQSSALSYCKSARLPEPAGSRPGYPAREPAAAPPRPEPALRVRSPAPLALRASSDVTCSGAPSGGRGLNPTRRFLEQPEGAVGSNSPRSCFSSRPLPGWQRMGGRGPRDNRRGTGASRDRAGRAPTGAVGRPGGARAGGLGGRPASER